MNCQLNGIERASERLNNKFVELKLGTLDGMLRFLPLA